ncbi:MAG: SGNH/GDSL hydrolase family protein [Janthinobacterium lividum]
MNLNVSLRKNSDIDRAEPPTPPTEFARTVFLGDSFTDGNTYPRLVRDSLAAANQGSMISICAGIGGNTIAQMHARLNRDVIANNPTLVMVSSGGNDCHQDVDAVGFGRDFEEIARILRVRDIAVILMTTSIEGPSHADKRPRLAEYDACITKIAASHGLRVAEVNKAQNAAEAQGIPQLCADDVHPNYEGQRSVARAVLDAMGYGDVPVVPSAQVRLNEGVVPAWYICPPSAGKEAMSASEISALKLDATWPVLRLPQPPLHLEREQLPAMKWLDDVRAEGAAVGLNQSLGSGPHYLAATLSAEKAAALQFHTGCELQSLWLNGRKIYTNDGTRGFHPGRESVTGTVVAGANFLVAEAGDTFYLSITDGPFW